ncbi:LuxR C-terminal-related transcriptional regulator [Nonomuraea sp. NPDC050310]|uniref:LuxR C-terminal-related transcriptional regulator n=1 Tax=Nonomuraea sp. NPDC050310 TaxID=3154935 RepID=UPI00340F299E
MWPFRGRDAQLAAIRSAAGGIVVAGPPGAGKSRLAAQAVEGSGAAWVRATEAAAELPLGAFAPLLPTDSPGGNPLGWAASAITAPLLVVDDAHLLDAASAALVHHLVVHRRTRVVVTVRAETTPPDAVRALWKDDLLPRLDLGPLTLEETADLLDAAMGGRVERESVARLWRASGGNALYLHELVLSGVLQRSGELWRWAREPSITPSLRQTIAGRIGRLTADEREVLEYLAYGEPLGAEPLAALTAEAAVERLEDRHLVTVDHDGRRLRVRLAHPLYGEVIRAGCGTLRARGLMRRLADAVAATGLRRREDVLRVAVWRLDGGAARDPDLLLRACQRARATRDLHLALRLARAATEAGGGLEAQLALAAILFYLDRYEESEEVYAAAWAREMDDDRRIECAITRSFNLFWGLGRSEAALAVLDEAEAGITGAEERQAAFGTRASLETFSGDLASASARLERVTSERIVHPRGRLAHGTTRAGLLLAECRLEECLAQVAEMRAEIARYGGDLPSMTAAVLDSAAAAHLLMGELDRAGEAAAEGYRLGGEFGTWPRAIQTFGSRQAQVARLRGRLADALGFTRDIVTRLPERAAFAGPCLGELALAHALRGEASAAEERLAEAERRALPIGPPVTAPVAFARIWTLAARGDLAGAVRAALELADETTPCFVPFALHDVVRLGRAELVADRLAAWPMEGRLLPLLARHAQARGAAELAAVSAEFAELGFLLFAAEAGAQAALAHHREGQARAARNATTRAWQLARACQGARTVALTDLEVPGLTPRQREIAMMAAQGLSNREIAERLVVSVRTVANTLGAVYEKTGARDRGELSAMIGAF